MSEKFSGFLGDGSTRRPGHSDESAGSLARRDNERWAAYAEIAKDVRQSRS
jgi:hypothetical protein